MTSDETDGDLRDRAGLRDTIERYFSSIDRRDWDTLLTCFTQDARFDSSGGDIMLDGREEILRRIQVSVGHFTATCHSMGNLSIRLDGDRATCTTLAVAHCLEGPVVSGRMLVRGLRYETVLSCAGDDRWRIELHEHIPLWQYETTTMPLMTVSAMD